MPRVFNRMNLIVVIYIVLKWMHRVQAMFGCPDLRPQLGSGHWQSSILCKSGLHSGNHWTDSATFEDWCAQHLHAKSQSQGTGHLNIRE